MAKRVRYVLKDWRGQYMAGFDEKAFGVRWDKDRTKAYTFQDLWQARACMRIWTREWRKDKIKIVRLSRKAKPIVFEPAPVKPHTVEPLPGLCANPLSTCRPSKPLPCEHPYPVIHGLSSERAVMWCPECGALGYRDGSVYASSHIDSWKMPRRTR